MVANIIITGERAAAASWLGPMIPIRNHDDWSKRLDFQAPSLTTREGKTKCIYQKISFIYKNKYLNRVTIIIEKFVYAVFNLFLLVIGDFAVLFIRSIIILLIEQFVVLILAVCTKILKVLFRPSYSARFTPITYRMNTSSTFKDCTHVLNLILTKKAYGCHIHI